MVVAGPAMLEVIDVNESDAGEWVVESFGRASYADPRPDCDLGDAPRYLFDPAPEPN
ncbi:hypothetical protein [Paraoerskovia marina]|uniref:hypothetical protein n=1 Tax=Paraoerskovia marina TaxID=545619 RepID=UPI001B80D0F7|nr:hypothetical protein [Paraoerskovia marina]